MDITRASGVKPRDIDFLWRGRVPRGMITVVAGKPDQGKGLFSIPLVAEVSRAGGKVLYSAIEDDYALMTVPRLKAAGANLDNVLLTEFMLPAQQREVENIVRDHKIDLIVIDPFSAHLSGVSKASDNIREVTNPLTKLIEETRTACVIIEHVNKRTGKTSDPLGAIAGHASGLPAASRAAFVLGVDPDDGDARVLCSVKFNIGLRPKAVRFQTDVADVEGSRWPQPFLIVEDDELEFDPSRLFDKPAGKVGRPPDRRAAAAEWLTNYLFDAGAPVPAGTVLEDAKQNGMTSKTLRAAAADMGVLRNPPGGGPKCTWELPQDIIDLMSGADGDATEEPAEDEGEELTQDDIDRLLSGDAPEGN